MKHTSKVQSGGGIPLYQLKITLKWSEPPIWRRVVARADMPLNRLHDLIQIVMGWTNSHMHQFIAGRAYYGQPHPDYADMGAEMLNEKRYTVAHLAPAAKSKFIYEYDFGDGWQHEVKVEKILPPDAAFQHPLCLAGEKACPPEDCGGLGGYYNLLEILADRRHPEHDEMKEWIGGNWDAESFDSNAVNAALKGIKA
jgi:hypothetical protein